LSDNSSYLPKQFI